jgi:hypothetical protein
MDKKLTLSVDEQLIKFAHDYSKTTHQSISKIFEKHLTRLQQELSNDEISEEAQALYGILDKGRVPDKKELRKAFYEKSLN